MLEDVKMAVAGGERQRGPAFLVQRRLDVDPLAVHELVDRDSARRWRHTNTVSVVTIFDRI